MPDNPPEHKDGRIAVTDTFLSECVFDFSQVPFVRDTSKHRPCGIVMPELVDYLMAKERERLAYPVVIDEMGPSVGIPGKFLIWAAGDLKYGSHDVVQADEPTYLIRPI